jgi:hypothetical protein
MASIDILGKDVPVEFKIGAGATAADLDEDGLLAGAREMARLINSKDWLPEQIDAFQGMKKIVFFAGKVIVDNNLMDRPCCDQDDAIFYWEAEEFFRNTDADVHANTFFHDCWHVVQFKAAGNRYAYTESERVWREVDAITQQIDVARTLGCSAHEIEFLEDFRADQDLIIARLDEGVGNLAPHKPGAMSAQAQV